MLSPRSFLDISGWLVSFLAATSTAKAVLALLDMMVGCFSLVSTVSALATGTNFVTVEANSWAVAASLKVKVKSVPAKGLTRRACFEPFSEKALICC